ncbi:MAG: glycosyltransferase WbuB [Xanthobacteraceae bacterium]
MRILFCGINYAPDLIGVAKYNTELCESLAARGHEVKVVTAPPYYPDWSVPEDYRSLWYNAELLNGIEVTRSPIYVPDRPSGSRRLLHHASFSISSFAPVLSKAVRWRPDIVFTVAPSLLSAPTAALAARTIGVPSWLHVQDLEIDAAFELGLLRNDLLRGLMLGIERRILRAFDRVSTISPQMRGRLAEKGVALEKLLEIRNWTDLGAIVPGNSDTRLRANLGLKPTDTVVLYSGAMSEKQGLDLVVTAAAATRESHPSIHYILCGNGPQKEELAERARGLANTHFIDLQPVELFSELLNTADIHCMPQKARAADLVLPSKLSGMLASGRPIIVMADPGTGIALETQDAGLVIPPGDAGELATAVKTLAENASLRRRLGAAGRVRAEQQWDRASVISSIEDEFSNLEPRSGRSGPLSAARKRYLLDKALRGSAVTQPPL